MSKSVLQKCNARPVEYISKPGAYITHNATQTLTEKSTFTMMMMC